MLDWLSLNRQPVGSVSRQVGTLFDGAGSVVVVICFALVESRAELNSSL